MQMVHGHINWLGQGFLLMLMGILRSGVAISEYDEIENTLLLLIFHLENKHIWLGNFKRQNKPAA